MLYRFFLLVSITTSSVCAVSEVPISKKTDLIYQRFYILKRLKKAHDMLASGQVNAERLHDLDSEQYTHAIIRQTAKNISEKANFAPMHRLWLSFAHYQYLYDTVFSDEIVLLFCSIYLLAYNQHIVRAVPLTSIKQLDLLDALIDGHAVDEQSFLVHKYELSTVHINHIAKRYFITKRLDKTMNFLQNIQMHDMYPFYKSLTGLLSIDYTDDILEDLHNFSHVRVHTCLADICNEKTLDPLVHMCNECKQYRYIQDDHFLEEMLRSIFLIYRTLLLKNMTGQTEQIIISEMSQVLEIYENLDRLTLDEVLNAIDLATDTLLAVQNMQVNEKQQHLWTFFSGGLIAVMVGIQILHYLDVI